MIKMFATRNKNANKIESPLSLHTSLANIDDDFNHHKNLVIWKSLLLVTNVNAACSDPTDSFSVVSPLLLCPAHYQWQKRNIFKHTSHSFILTNDANVQSNQFVVVKPQSQRHPAARAIWFYYISYIKWIEVSFFEIYCSYFPIKMAVYVEWLGKFHQENDIKMCKCVCVKNRYGAVQFQYFFTFRCLSLSVLTAS